MASEDKPAKSRRQDEPEAALSVGDGAGEELPDVISDPGVEGGVDVVNEEPEEPETEA